MWNSVYPASIPSWHALVCFLRLVWTWNLYITRYKCMKSYGPGVRDWSRLHVNCQKFWIQNFALWAIPQCGYLSQSLKFSITLGHTSISAHISCAILWRCCLWCHSGKTCSEIWLLLHHEQFLWLDWIAYDFLAQTHHQMLLPWPFLSDLKSTTYIDINASFLQGFSVHIFTWGLHLALCSPFQRQHHSYFPAQPSPQTAKAVEYSLFVPGVQRPWNFYSQLTRRKWWGTSHVSSVSWG